MGESKHSETPGVRSVSLHMTRQAKRADRNIHTSKHPFINPKLQIKSRAQKNLKCSVLQLIQLKCQGGRVKSVYTQKATLKEKGKNVQSQEKTRLSQYVWMHGSFPLIFQIWQHPEFDTGHVTSIFQLDFSFHSFIHSQNRLSFCRVAGGPKPIPAFLILVKHGLHPGQVTSSSLRWHTINLQTMHNHRLTCMSLVCVKKAEGIQTRGEHANSTQPGIEPTTLLALGRQTWIQTQDLLAVRQQC